MNIMRNEEKIQLLGEELIALNERVIKLCRVLRVINQFHRDSNKQHGLDLDNITQWGNDCVDWLEGNLDAVEYKYEDILQMRNELTYLHNEVVGISKLLGRYGDAPKIKPTSKVKYK